MSKNWYSVASEYWKRQEVSVEGVLGGFGRLSGTDVLGSQKFIDALEKKFPENFQKRVVLDCGAGIGRVTKEFLSTNFQVADLVEPCENLLQKAVEDLKDTKCARNFYLAPLQSFDPSNPPLAFKKVGEPGNTKYDMIWCQWVLLYLTDADLVAFFRRCAESLENGGFICLKENVVLQGQSIVDHDDCSVTRNLNEYRVLAERAGLDVCLEMRQSVWPSEVYPVMMFALKKKNPKP